MKNNYKAKKVVLIILIIIIIGAIVISISPKKEKIIAPYNNTTINADAERLFVENYIKDNIVTIATDKPVLGGTWYAVSVIANPVAHTGEVTYEDGHIQSKANFTYSYQTNPQRIIVTKWEVIE